MDPKAMINNTITQPEPTLTHAIVLFVGFGSDSFPSRNRERLVQEFGPSLAASLESQVVILLDEIGKIQVDWSLHSLQSAGEMARAEMKARHPALSDTTLLALEWKFLFDWK
jgi:hypothetical protein